MREVVSLLSRNIEYFFSDRFRPEEKDPDFFYELSVAASFELGIDPSHLLAERRDSRGARSTRKPYFIQLTEVSSGTCKVQRFASPPQRMTCFGKITFPSRPSFFYLLGLFAVSLALRDVGFSIPIPSLFRAHLHAAVLRVSSVSARNACFPCNGTLSPRIFCLPSLFPFSLTLRWNLSPCFPFLQPILFFPPLQH